MWEAAFALANMGFMRVGNDYQAMPSRFWAETRGTRYMMVHVLMGEEWLPTWVPFAFACTTQGMVGRLPEPPPAWLVEADAEEEIAAAHPVAAQAAAGAARTAAAQTAAARPVAARPEAAVAAAFNPAAAQLAMVGAAADVAQQQQERREKVLQYPEEIRAAGAGSAAR